MSDSTDELIRKIRTGDTEALVAFADAHKPQLLAFIRRRMSDGMQQKTEPQDILQEAVLSAVNSLDSRHDDGWEPFGWLCQLAERRIVDSHRHFHAQKRAADQQVALDARKGGDEGGLIDVLVASLTSPSEAFSKGQREYELLQAMEGLPDDARTALKMRYVENRPSKEIAEALGKSDGATRVLLTRSLQKLQKTLSENTLFQSFVQPPADGER